MSEAPTSHAHVWRAGEAGARTLLLLHGTGGDERDLLPLADALDKRANVLSPRGNVLENGMPRFFRRHAEGVLDLDDLRARTQALARFVREQAGARKFAAKDTVAVGFSNGANIAAALLFEEPDVLGGAVLIRAMLPYEPDHVPEVTGKRVLLLAGAHDPYSQPEATERLARILREGGAEVDIHYAQAGHGLVPADVERAQAWLAEVPAP